MNNFQAKIKSWYDKNPLLAVFSVRAALIYLGWFIFYESGNFNFYIIDQFLIEALVDTSKVILDLLGYETFEYGKIVGIQNSSGVEIGTPCNAFSLFILYAGFLISFPLRGKRKLLFIVLGILSIHLLNNIRVLALILLAFHNPSVLEFNHSYTFTLAVYLWIFMVWLYWINKYAKSEKKA